MFYMAIKPYDNKCQGALIGAEWGGGGDFKMVPAMCH